MPWLCILTPGVVMTRKFQENLFRISARQSDYDKHNENTVSKERFHRVPRHRLASDDPKDVEMSITRSYGRVDEAPDLETQDTSRQRNMAPTQGFSANKTNSHSADNDDDILILSDSGKYVPIERLEKSKKRKRSSLDTGFEVKDAVRELNSLHISTPVDLPTQHTRKKARSQTFERQMAFGKEKQKKQKHKSVEKRAVVGNENPPEPPFSTFVAGHLPLNTSN
jgi:hypothetical protein